MSEAALEPHLPLCAEGKSSPVLFLCPAPTPQLPARERMPHPPLSLLIPRPGQGPPASLHSGDPQLPPTTQAQSPTFRGRAEQGGWVPVCLASCASWVSAL
ncbi:unnamed protein product [Rangifer tarandus platyrhynchus]|uniref:Uncharacterized protein n=2 Tax=Rangifer tarandus platyrhynchus TaxID=3082113 RepID=A0ABN8YVK8_RANTA|nr:unnamed protein product [Rangifer tarandus platyrhynchus]